MGYAGASGKAGKREDGEIAKKGLGARLREVKRGREKMVKQVARTNRIVGGGQKKRRRSKPIIKKKPVSQGNDVTKERMKKLCAAYHRVSKRP